MLVLTVGLLAGTRPVAERSLAEQPANSHTQEVTKQDPDAKSELKGLHGSWMVTGITYGHKEMHITRVKPPEEQSGWMIFSHEEDRLRIAFIDALKGRPVDFKPCPELVVIDLSRKAEEKSK